MGDHNPDHTQSAILGLDVAQAAQYEVDLPAAARALTRAGARLHADPDDIALAIAAISGIVTAEMRTWNRKRHGDGSNRHKYGPRDQGRAVYRGVCRTCSREMFSRCGVIPDGGARSSGRGLCSACEKAERRARKKEAAA